MKSNPKESNFVSAVVYVCNCAKDIGYFLDGLYQTLTENFKHFEIICVDDASNDDTCKELENFKSKALDTELTILHMGTNQGLEPAMNAGIDFSIGDFVFEFDTHIVDYDFSLIMDAYYKALKGFDVVNMVPNKQSRTTSKLFYQVFNRYSNLQNELSTNRFRLVSRRVINRVHDMNTSIPYRKVAYAASGLKGITMTYSANKNIALIKNHHSTNKNRKELALNSFIMFTDIAYRFSSLMSILFAAFALLVGIYTIIIFCTKGAVEGWTTTMIFLSIAFFGIFIIQTMLVKYMAIVVDLLVSRKEYTIESIEKVTM